MPDLMAFIALRRLPVTDETYTARYEQLLTDSMANAPPPDAIQVPPMISNGALVIATLVGVGLVSFGFLALLIWDVAVVGIILAAIGLLTLILSWRAWHIRRGSRRHGELVAVGLLNAADRAERRAEDLAASGASDEARAAMELAADRLRALAPGSGRPHEVMERAHRLRQRAAELHQAHGVADPR